jgi:hypothetical protein
VSLHPLRLTGGDGDVDWPRAVAVGMEAVGGRLIA